MAKWLAGTKFQIETAPIQEQAARRLRWVPPEVRRVIEEELQPYLDSRAG